MRKPGLGEWLWRIPGYWLESEVDCIEENVKGILERGGEDDGMEEEEEEEKKKSER